MNQQKGNISVVVSFIIVFVIVGLVVYGLTHKTASNVEIPSGQINSNTTANTESNPAKEDAKTIKEEPKVTKNKNMEQVAKNGDTLVMNYTGKLVDGTVFDSNVDPKFHHVTPFEFTLGAGMVIKGWDEGLVGMKVGEKKTLTIPPEKGYGSQGVGSIPPNSTLIFDVELVGIK